MRENTSRDYGVSRPAGHRGGSVGGNPRGVDWPGTPVPIVALRNNSPGPGSDRAIPKNGGWQASHHATRYNNIIIIISSLLTTVAIILAMMGEMK